MKRIVSGLGELGRVKRACAVFVLCTMAAIALPAQTFTTLHSFNYADGQGPAAGPTQGSSGELYGTVKNGGANCASTGGCGTIYKITTSGVLTTLYSFCSLPNCADGKYPLAGGAGGPGGLALVQATNGNYYGTTAAGGAHGKGTVFQLTPSGTLTTIYSFSGAPTDGQESVAGLVQATNGELYGTTSFGGVGCGSECAGTVFKITTSGVLTTLYSFTYNTPFGFSPPAGLMQATNGLLYGATASTQCCPPPDTSRAGTKPHGPGGLFQITPSGTLAPLYTFCSLSGCADGENPFTSLVQTTNGQLFGTAANGGANGSGTIFQITPSGALTVIYNFCSLPGCADGTIPDGLIQGSDGNLYGTAYGGGANGYGTIFQITPSGTLTTLHSFDLSDGALPFVGLTQATDGNFYGTTYLGGANGDGAIFKLSIGLSPFVETQTTSGTVGAPVRILGTNLTGATSVTFNGTPATFTVVSRYLITTTVPAGATTGTIQVVTPSGTLLSNAPFRIP